MTLTHPTDFNPTHPVVFNADYCRVTDLPIRYGVALLIGETRFGDYRSFTTLSVENDQAACWMA